MFTPKLNFSASWSDSNKVLTIEFDENLSYSKNYVLVIGKSAKDLAGNAILEQFILGFSTESLPAPDPDKDDDGMDDEWEEANGFNSSDPTDAGSYPTSMWWFWVLLIVLRGALGAVGWYLYRQTREEEKGAEEKVGYKKKVPKLKPIPRRGERKVEKLRELREEKEDYIDLEKEAKKQAKLKALKEKKKADLFDSLGRVGQRERLGEKKRVGKVVHSS